MNNIYKNSHTLLTQINNLFKNLIFRDCEIFDSLEPLLRDEIIFIEKAKYVLKNKKSMG